MTAIERFLQRRRIHAAARFLAPGMQVLDLGCADGALFRQLPCIRGIGIDPDLRAPFHLPNAVLLPGHLPNGLPERSDFDAVTMLAVLEHLPRAVQVQLADKLHSVLQPKGTLILTVPSAKTDRVLVLLKTFRLIHGRSLEQHYGFDAQDTPKLFGSFRAVHAGKFQLGFNNVFVFENA